METAELTTMCLVRDASTGRILVQNRKKSWKGIACPGGHVEPGESFTQCAKREVWEETGLTIDKLRLCGVKDFYHADINKRYIVFLFITECYEGSLLSHCEEGDPMWVLPDDVWDMELASGFADTLRVMLSAEHCEHFFEPPEPGQSAWRSLLLS